MASRKAGVLAAAVCAVALILPPGVKGADDNKTNSASAAGDEVYDMGSEIEPPKLVHVVEPSFNPSSEEAYTSGVIKLRIIVTKDGKVRDPKVLSGPNERQNKAATDAVLQWRFKPGLKKGEPVNVRATVEVNFHLL